MSKLDQFTFDIDHADGLQGESWHFYLLDTQLVVDRYTRWTRPSKRHKPTVLARWSRLESRMSTMKKEDVPLTPRVQEWAKRTWLQTLETTVSVGFQS